MCIIIKKIKKLFLLFFFILLLISCSVEQKFVPPKKVIPLNQLYKSAYKEYENGNWSVAIDQFKKVQINYPYSNWAAKAYLMTAYIYYESGEYISSLEITKKFKEFYPIHKDLPYVEFLIGLCFYEQIETIARDQTNTKLAIKQFKKLIKKYPNTYYAEESKFKIDLLNEQMAGKEMYIARYYIKRKKWTAAILRLHNVINKYETTVFIDEALHRMVEINYYLGNIDNAKKYAAILGYNFNTSDWYKKSYKIVGKKDKDYEDIKKIKKKKIKEKILEMFKFSK
jgi:outer membrane protein assembly factor BamD